MGRLVTGVVSGSCSLKRSLTALFVLVLVCFLARPPAHADVKEGDWSASPTNRGTSASTVVDNKKAIRPNLNITQPKLQVRAPTYLLDGLTDRKAKPAKRSRKKTARRKTSSKRSSNTGSTKRATKRLNIERAELEKWWNSTGNPAVFGFRDCLSQHAVQLRELAGPVAPQVHIAKAMDETCRIEFDHMASTIATRFGEDGFNKLSAELIRTTFVPAVTVTQ